LSFGRRAGGGKDAHGRQKIRFGREPKVSKGVSPKEVRNGGKNEGGLEASIRGITHTTGLFYCTWKITEKEDGVRKGRKSKGKEEDGKGGRQKLMTTFLLSIQGIEENLKKRGQEKKQIEGPGDEDGFLKVLTLQKICNRVE